MGAVSPIQAWFYPSCPSTYHQELHSKAPLVPRRRPAAPTRPWRTALGGGSLYRNRKCTTTLRTGSARRGAGGLCQWRRQLQTECAGAGERERGLREGSCEGMEGAEARPKVVGRGLWRVGSPRAPLLSPMSILLGRRQRARPGSAVLWIQFAVAVRGCTQREAIDGGCRPAPPYLIYWGGFLFHLLRRPAHYATSLAVGRGRAWEAVVLAVWTVVTASYSLCSCSTSGRR